jgi:lysophospholipase L1-like esterase
MLTHFDSNQQKVVFSEEKSLCKFSLKNLSFQNTKMWKKLIVIGASNVEYGFSEQGKWVSMLSDALSRRCDVINRGFSGFTSRHLRIILPTILKEFKAGDICAVTILLGTNDSAQSVNHVPLDEYARLMREMIELMLKHGVPSDKIVIMTPPLRKYFQLPRTEGAEDPIEEYAASCIHLARDCNVSCFDLRSLMKADGRPIDEYFVDSVHFSEYGSTLLFKGLMQVLEKLFAKYDLDFKYPVSYWEDLLQIKELKDNFV